MLCKWLSFSFVIRSSSNTDETTKNHNRMIIAFIEFIITIAVTVTISYCMIIIIIIIALER